MIYRCPNNCHTNDKGGRCPRCGAWMLKDTHTVEEAQQKTADIQNSHKGETGGRIKNRHSISLSF